MLMQPQLNASQTPVTGSYSRIGAPVVTRIQLVHQPSQQLVYPHYSQGARHPQYAPQQVYPQYFQPAQQQVYWYGDPQQQVVQVPAPQVVRVPTQAAITHIKHQPAQQHHHHQRGVSRPQHVTYTQRQVHSQHSQGARLPQYAPQQVPSGPQNVAYLEQVQQTPQNTTSTRDAGSSRSIEVNSSTTNTVSPTQPNLEKIISSLEELLKRIPSHDKLYQTLAEHLKSIQSNTDPKRALNGLNTTLSKMVATNDDARSLPNYITLKEQQYRQLCEQYRFKYLNKSNLSDEERVKQQQALGVISEVINEKEALITQLKTIKLLDDVKIVRNHLHDLMRPAATPESKTTTDQQAQQQESQNTTRNTSIEVQSATTKPDSMESEQLTRENTPETLREIKNVKINKLLNDLKSNLSTLPSSEINDTLIDNIDTILSAFEWEVELYDSDEASMTDALKTQPNFLINLNKLAGLLPADHPPLAIINSLITLLEEQSPDNDVLSAASTPERTDTPPQNPEITPPLAQFIKSSFDDLPDVLKNIKIYIDKKIENQRNSSENLDKSQLTKKLIKISHIVNSLIKSSKDDSSSFLFKKDTIKLLETLQTLLPGTSVDNFLALYRFTAYESPNFNSHTIVEICKQHAKFFSSESSFGTLDLLQNDFNKKNNISHYKLQAKNEELNRLLEENKNHDLQRNKIKKEINKLKYYIEINTTIIKAIDTIKQTPFLSCDRDMTSAMQTLNKVVEIKKLPLYIKLKLQSLLNAYNLIKALSESGFSKEQLKQLFPEEDYQLNTILV